MAVVGGLWHKQLLRGLETRGVTSYGRDRRPMTDPVMAGVGQIQLWQGLEAYSITSYGRGWRPMA